MVVILKNAVLKLIMQYISLSSLCETALRWMPQDLNNGMSAMVQVMACCRQTASHYLHSLWANYLSKPHEPMLIDPALIHKRYIPWSVHTILHLLWFVVVMYILISFLPYHSRSLNRLLSNHLPGAIKVTWKYWYGYISPKDPTGIDKTTKSSKSTTWRIFHGIQYMLRPFSRYVLLYNCLLFICGCEGSIILNKKWERNNKEKLLSCQAIYNDEEAHFMYEFNHRIRTVVTFFYQTHIGGPTRHIHSCQGLNIS